MRARNARQLAAWAVVLLVVLALELLLRDHGRRLLPRPNKWGHTKVQELVERYESHAASSQPLDVVIFGTSQGYTWIDQRDLNRRGIKTINASIPGGNVAVSRLLARDVLFGMKLPRVVLVTVGPMSVAHWNEHLEQIIRQSPLGGAHLNDDQLTLWAQRNLALFAYGGQRIDSAFVANLRALWSGRSPRARSQRAAVDGDAVAAEGRPPLVLEPSADQFQALRDLVREIERRGVRTAFMNMPVCEASKHRPEWPYADYHRSVVEVVGRRPFLDLDREAVASYLGDCSHPTPEGIAAFRDRIATFTREVLNGPAHLPPPSPDTTVAE